MRLPSQTRCAGFSPAGCAGFSPAGVSVGPLTAGLATACLVAACVVTAGCTGLAVVADRDSFPGADATPIVARRPPAAQPATIPVELSFIRFDEADAVLTMELWDTVDEQWLPAAARRLLAANGLRCGIVTSDLPPHVAERLAAGTWDTATTDGLLPGASRRTVRLLPGRRADVVTAAPTSELIVLSEDVDGTRGETFREAGGYLELRGWPGGGGQVRLELTPEIRHGPIRRTWVGEEGRFRIEAGQTRHRFEQLRIAGEVPDGGMLVIGPGGETAATVGDALFGDRAGGGGGVRQLLVVRPLTPAVDPVFGGDGASRED
jgi:hypothetical protein